MSSSKAIYEFGDWRLDAAEQLLLRDGQAVPLTPKAFETLLLLVENAGRLVTKQEFMDRVWPDTFVEDAALAQNISQLRKTLALASAFGLLIETVPKRGYRFLGPVRLVPANGNGTSGPQAFGPTAATPETAGEKSAPLEERVATLEASDRESSTFTLSPAQGSLSLRVVGVTLAALALIALVTFGILRHGRSLRVASAGLRSRGGSSAENQPAPKISPLISLPGEERMPAFSPDGSRVAFVWHNPQSKKSGIYAVVVGSQTCCN
jgi:DNA-binding winged helix-turn-helix (wHTH) protein